MSIATGRFPGLRYPRPAPIRLPHVYLEAEEQDASDRTWLAPIDPARPRVRHWPLTANIDHLDNDFERFHPAYRECP